MRVCQLVVPSPGHAGLSRSTSVAPLVSPLGLSAGSVGVFPHPLAAVLPKLWNPPVAGRQRRLVHILYGMPRWLQPDCPFGVGSGPGPDARNSAMPTPRQPGIPRTSTVQENSGRNPHCGHRHQRRPRFGARNRHRTQPANKRLSEQGLRCSKTGARTGMVPQLESAHIIEQSGSSDREPVYM